MAKAVNFFKYVLFGAVLTSLCLLVYGFFSVPDEFYAISVDEIKVNNLYSLNISAQADVKSAQTETVDTDENYKVEVTLLNAIPVKTATMRISKRNYVVISGDIFGLRLYTKGVVIVGTSTVETAEGVKNPAQEAGIAAGDVIVSINGVAVESCAKVSELFSSCGGTPVTLVYRRNGNEYSTVFPLYYSTAEQKYLAGLWIRDSAAGIGTMTFYDKSSGVYAGLGHGVCDADTGSILPLYDGDIVSVEICGCYKGKSGDAGELCGTFTGGTTGSMCINNECGVYGVLNNVDISAKEMPVALKSEVHEGEAQIVSTVNGDGPKYYTIEIEKVNKNDSSYRNMVIKVTDQALIEQTGGIVQGMSGSPIIQNGMLVGAVTHVFINDPLSGYAIFAEYMLETSKTVSRSSMNIAS
ncbi:MAG: SpoIVB peptidase [Faecalibacterium sp.]|nr:SpoIVB peptidase [Ruminococcus sp.]MCM1392789.1 SpoIVB peptidase [Ruminococcus sp.]MCM1485521.1 SpoIVB peptidase [Faecalibacterium sp.]